MDTFIQTSQGLASLFGESQGRTTSRVIGQGLSNATGLSHDAATDIAHLAMLAAAAKPELRTPIGVTLAGLFVAGLAGRR